MAIARDFRRYTFSATRVERCAHYIADECYWKLYAVENTIRVVIASVLSVQLGPNWWTVVLNPHVAKNILRFRAQYLAKPKHASPGRHDIYMLFLSELNQILRIQSNQLRPVIRDVDRWIARLEGIRLPRNLVGHMNFPNYYDRDRINNAYSRLPGLITQIQARGIPILTP